MTSDAGRETPDGSSDSVPQRSRHLAAMSLIDQGFVSGCSFLTVVAVGRGVSNGNDR